MYCPKCLNDTLKVRSSGVAKLLFNGKHRDTSLFTYNLTNQSNLTLLNKLEDRIIDFMSWYANFNNKNAITEFELFSSDFICDNGCAIDNNVKISLIGPIYTPKQVLKILKTQGEKFQIEISIDAEDLEK
jgi:hypothetical protein